MDGTTDAQKYGADDEELTARMFFKLANVEFHRPDRRARFEERGGFNEFQKLHNRQKTAGGGRDSGQ